MGKFKPFSPKRHFFSKPFPRINPTEVASSTATSIDYRVVNPVRVEPPKTKEIPVDPGATWAVMLQTAELKATLEGKMELLSQQIRSLQNTKTSDQPPLQGTDSCQFCGELPEMRVSASSASLGGRSGRLALKQHEECQHKFKDHRCLYCGKRFFYAVSLKAHVRGGHAGGSKGDLTT